METRNHGSVQQGQDQLVMAGHGDGLAVGTIKLRAKGKVEIAGVANWAEGDWYVRQVTHIIADQNYLTRFVVTR